MIKSLKQKITVILFFGGIIYLMGILPYQLHIARNIFKENCFAMNGVAELGPDTNGANAGGRTLYCKNANGNILDKGYFGG